MRQLVERIRWGNVARLCAVVAAGLLITMGPRACSGGNETAPLPPDTRVEPPARPPVAATPDRRRPKPKRAHHKPKRAHRKPNPPHRASPTMHPAPLPPAPQVAPSTPPAPPTPPSQTAPRRGSAPEFP